jgi:hypothetical protein
MGLVGVMTLCFSQKIVYLMKALDAKPVPEFENTPTRTHCLDQRLVNCHSDLAASLGPIAFLAIRWL